MSPDDVDGLLEWWQDAQETATLVGASKVQTERRKAALEMEHAALVSEHEGKFVEGFGTSQIWEPGSPGSPSSELTISEREGRMEREVFEAEKRLAKAKVTLESTFALGRQAIEQLTMVLSRVAITAKYSGVQHGAILLRQNALKQHALHDELFAKL